MGVNNKPLYIGQPVGSGTSGSVTFIDSNTQLAQDNTGLYYDSTNNYLGINKGAYAPTTALNTGPGGSIAVDLATPGAPSGTPSTTGGSMVAGTYYYVIVANDQNTGQTIKGAESSAQVIASGTTGSVALSWATVPGAASYHIYRTTVSGTYTTPALIKTFNAGLTFTDTLASPSAGAPPATTTGYASFFPSSGSNPALIGQGSMYLGGNGTVTTMVQGALNVVTLAQANFMGLRIHNEGTTGTSLIQFDCGNGNGVAQPTKIKYARASSAESSIAFNITTSSSDTEVMRIANNRVSIGNIAPTARLHLPAGGSAASGAPLKFTSGTSLGTAEAGAVEFTTDDFYATITTGAARKGIILNDGTNLTSGKIPVATTNGRLIDSAGISATIPIAPVSPLTVAGSATFTNGILTAYTAPS